jgi:hypothetical protein
MTPIIAGILMRGGGTITCFEIIVFSLAAGAVLLVGKQCNTSVKLLKEVEHGFKRTAER